MLCGEELFYRDWQRNQTPIRAEPLTGVEIGSFPHPETLPRFGHCKIANEHAPFSMQAKETKYICNTAAVNT